MDKEQLDKILKEHLQWIITNGEQGTRANLREANLNGTDLRETNLSGANLIAANLSGSNLSEADLSGTDLREADLSGADLSGANLSGANLREADLIGTDLFGADLIGTDLFGANLFGANLSGANLSGANLREANLSGANLFLRQGKQILTFQSSFYFAYYCDGIVKIGCQSKTPEEWLAVDIDEIKRAHNITNEVVAEYKAFIELVMKVRR